MVSYPLTLFLYQEETDSGYIPASGEPGPHEILAALKEAICEDPGLQEHPPEEVTSKKSPPLPLWQRR